MSELFGTDFPTIKTIADWEGIFCGNLAIYAALAQILNELYGRTVMPFGTK